MLAKKCTLCGEFLYSPWRKIVQFILPFTHINKFIAPSFYDHDNDDTHTNKRGRGSDKTPVVGMIDRNNKKVFSKIALPNGKGQRLTANQLMDLLKQVSKQENKNTIMNDEFKG
jgi:hypothetical protein